MKKIHHILYVLLAMTILGLNSCIEQTYDSSIAMSSQVERSPAALEGLSNATAGFMYKYNPFGQSSQVEFGYPAAIITKDMMASDVVLFKSGYDHFRSPWGGLTSSLAAGNSIIVTWRFYYTLILNAHNTITSIKHPDDAEKVIQQYYGNALVYRALAYMDLMRMYEYKRTGVDMSDEEAEKNNLWGLTTVLLDENTDPQTFKNNPRAPFYTMYRFIMSDLNKAEKYLDGFTRPSKNKADLSVVYAYKARLWLEIATRFQKDSEKGGQDFDTMLAHESDAEITYDKLGVTTIKQCYENAVQYARKAIAAGGNAPLTKSEWHSLENGFNSSASNSWMFAVIVGSQESVYHTFRNFIGSVCTEYEGGMCNSRRQAYRMIDARLFSKIEDADWRKSTWIDPKDAGKAPDRKKYSSLLSDSDWKLRPAYTGFKFRPGGMERENYKIACQTDVPIIRVEEMYFIEAEALTYTQGLAAGVSALKDFINTYRYTDGSYDPKPLDVDDFVDNYLLVQKRVEFWLEGLTFYDLKRREQHVTRGYKGTNFLAAQRFNSRPGYPAPWFNCFFPRSQEVGRNPALIQNPNPVPNPTTLWVE